MIRIGTAFHFFMIVFFNRTHEGHLRSNTTNFVPFSIKSTQSTIRLVLLCSFLLVLAKSTTFGMKRAFFHYVITLLRRLLYKVTAPLTILLARADHVQAFSLSRTWGAWLLGTFLSSNASFSQAQKVEQSPEATTSDKPPCFKPITFRQVWQIRHYNCWNNPLQDWTIRFRKIRLIAPYFS